MTRLEGFGGRGGGGGVGGRGRGEEEGGKGGGEGVDGGGADYVRGVVWVEGLVGVHYCGLWDVGIWEVVDEFGERERWRGVGCGWSDTTGGLIAAGLVRVAGDKNM